MPGSLETVVGVVSYFYSCSNAMEVSARRRAFVWHISTESNTGGLLRLAVD